MDGSNRAFLYNRRVIRLVSGVVVLAAIALGAGMFIGAGRAPGPTIEIHQPTGLFGRVATFEASVDPMDGELTQGAAPGQY